MVDLRLAPPERRGRVRELRLRVTYCQPGVVAGRT